MRARGLRSRVAVALGCVLGSMSCGTSPREQAEPEAAAEAEAAALEPAADAGARARGSALIESLQCTRCHDVPGHAPAKRDRHCVRCHQEILAGTFEAPAEALAEWKGHIHHLLEVPALAGTERFRRAWVADYLRAPHDVRPGLNTTMPRLALQPDQAADLAAALVPAAEEPAPALAEAEKGRELLAISGCMLCHRMTGAPNLGPGKLAVPLDEAAFQRGLAQAPDLRFARARMRPAALVAWLLDPPALKPGTAMPKIPLSETEARQIAAYLRTTPLAEAPAGAAPQRLPVLERRVTWAEVEARVFKQTCWHCHSDPDYARGDGGPGNSGGFGFTPRGLNLASYGGIASGSVGDDGKRRSVFAALPDGTPRLVAHLLARHAEVAGLQPELRGMPLGLTPVPLADIQLVDTWIAQGRPQE